MTMLPMTSTEAWRAEMRAQSMSRNTIKVRIAAVRMLARAAGVEPAALELDHILDYLAERDLAPDTVKHYLRAVDSYFAYLGRPTPTEGIRRPRVPRRTPRPVSETGLTRMLLAARRDHPEFAWIILGAWCGTRSFETAKVHAEDLEETPGGWSLRIVGKGGVDELVPLPDIVHAALVPWLDRSCGRGRLWPEASAHIVQSAIRRVAQRAGVRCSSHMLRHRYGTAVYAASTDLLLTQQLMRHASPTTTAGYARVAADKARPVVDRLPGATPGVTPITRGQAS